MKFNFSCKLLVICAFFLGLQTSCTVEKRLYRPGYHIEWKKKKSFDAAQKSTKTEELQSEASVVEAKIELTDLVFKDSVFDVLPLSNSTSTSEKSFSEIELDEVKYLVDFEKIDDYSLNELERDQLQKENKQSSRIEADWISVLYLILIGLAFLGLGLLFFYFLSEVFILGILFFFIFLTAAAICVLYGFFLMLYLLFFA